MASYSNAVDQALGYQLDHSKILKIYRFIRKAHNGEGERFVAVFDIPSIVSP
jgi:hypothetical protein